MTQQMDRAVDEPIPVRALLRDEFITMAHGSGGKATQHLIDAVFLPEFSNPLLDAMEDQATFQVDASGPRLAFTTDSFVVSPVFFPGGNIGELAANGTINDLAMAGAVPLHLSAAFILEEGFPAAQLQSIVRSMADACAAAGTAIVTGDTKVVPRGKADGLFINTAGIGVIQKDVHVSVRNARPGDKVIASGFLGNHDAAIMLARGGFDIEANIQSDTASLSSLVQTMLDTNLEVHCLRDPTRGGAATVLNEIAQHSRVGIVLDEAALPIQDDVRGACEILGIDPLHVANEGKLLAVVDRDAAEPLVAAMRRHPLGEEAAIIGEVVEEPRGRVILHTPYGGSRMIDMLVGDPLPRIC